jgi:hypothetical protein
MGKKKRHGRHTLPPHSWETHPLANAGEVSKMLLIAIVAIVAVIGLVVLLFFMQGPFAGKAIEFGEALPNEAGIFAVGDHKIGDGLIDIPITLNLGDNSNQNPAKSTAISFELPFDRTKLRPIDCALADATLRNYYFVDRKDLSLVKSCSTQGGKITLEYAWLCNEDCSNALTQEDLVFRFTPQIVGEHTLDFTHFDVYDIETGEDLIGEGTSGVIKIVENDAPPLEVLSRVVGTKVTVEDLGVVGTVYKTRVTATAITGDFSVYTQLMGARGAVMVLEKRNLNLANGEVVEINVDSAGKEVSTKQVLAYDTFNILDRQVGLGQPLTVSYLDGGDED